jgi:hypothetical protein
MPKTGRGVDTAALMTGSPAKQTSQRYLDLGAKIKRDEQGKGQLTENSSYMNQLRGYVPAASGQLYKDPSGKSRFPDNNSAGDILDGDGDGDSVLNDSNDDGTMLSRAAKAIYKAVTK